ncbi:Ger(x)C family spore germination protein [Paenibacillus glycanilyticus]|uniref:Ger(x)C family spore germination protein n=1 Tax=Paenibacillus glycanilyticus TaxID=126569 RepID=UPI00203B8327|nr:Ger(x)C family spore germination protein [Paenibacillus glycanilyticus]MCM3627058.1 Ger(x)C family spore germination protein [Paenibacillus glycanilyticus]
MRSLWLLLIVPLLSGCWDRVEMNDVSFFMASALDMTDKGEMKVSIQVPIPVGAGSGEGGKASAGGSLGKTYFVVTSTGINIHDAERKIQNKMSRQFFKGHRRVVFVGEKFARRGIKDVLDYYSRDPGSRLRTYIVVAKGGEASKLLLNDHPIERIPAEDVRELETSGTGTSVTFRDFLMTQANEGIVPVMGAVELFSPTVDSGNEEHFRLNSLSSTAVFKNYRLVGYLNDIETRSMNWIKNKLDQTIVAEKLLRAGGNVGAVLNSTSSRIVTTFNGDKVLIHIVLNGTGVLNEANVDMDMSNPKNISDIERELGEAIAGQALRTVKKAQTEWKADVFGIGLQLHRFQPNAWKKVRGNWDETFAGAEVSVKANIKLHRAGIITDSLTNERTEAK